MDLYQELKLIYNFVFHRKFDTENQGKSHEKTSKFYHRT
jgi:hypothetical protein